MIFYIAKFSFLFVNYYVNQSFVIYSLPVDNIFKALFRHAIAAEVSSYCIALMACLHCFVAFSKSPDLGLYDPDCGCTHWFVSEDGTEAWAWADGGCKFSGFVGLWLTEWDGLLGWDGILDDVIGACVPGVYSVPVSEKNIFP